MLSHMSLRPQPNQTSLFGLLSALLCALAIANIISLVITVEQRAKKCDQSNKYLLNRELIQPEAFKAQPASTLQRALTHWRLSFRLQCLRQEGLGLSAVSQCAWTSRDSVPSFMRYPTTGRGTSCAH